MAIIHSRDGHGLGEGVAVEIVRSGEIQDLYFLELFIPLREAELLTIVISVVWVRIAGAAASPGFLGRGAAR